MIAGSNQTLHPKKNCSLRAASLSWFQSYRLCECVCGRPVEWDHTASARQRLSPPPVETSYAPACAVTSSAPEDGTQKRAPRQFMCIGIGIGIFYFSNLLASTQFMKYIGLVNML